MTPMCFGYLWTSLDSKPISEPAPVGNIQRRYQAGARSILCVSLPPAAFHLRHASSPLFCQLLSGVSDSCLALIARLWGTLNEEIYGNLQESKKLYKIQGAPFSEIFNVPGISHCSCQIPY